MTTNLKRFHEPLRSLSEVEAERQQGAAMTFEAKLRCDLSKRGLFPDQVDEVVKRVKAAPENEVMAYRWNDDTDGYPPAMLGILWFTTKRHALAYIDETCPQAWFRPLFADEGTGLNP
jgi:hypothetical protein